MRRYGTILLSIMLILAGASCHRRPFSDNTTAVNIKLKVKTDVTHSRAASDVETMRIDLFDLTDQFFDNDEYHLIVENPIVIEEPKVEGGGFVPSVGEWEDVTTDIEL